MEKIHTSSFSDNFEREICYLNEVIFDAIKLVPRDFCVKTIGNIGENLASVSIKKSSNIGVSLKDKMIAMFGDRTPATEVDFETYNLKENFDKAESFSDLRRIADILIANEIPIDNTPVGCSILSEFVTRYGYIKQDENFMYQNTCLHYGKFKQGHYTEFFKRLQEAVETRDDIEYSKFLNLLREVHLCTN